MMNRTIRAMLSCWMAAVLLLSIALPSFAAGETAAAAAPYLNSKGFWQVNAVDNDLTVYPEGFDHGYIPNVRTVQNEDGSYAICVDEGSQLRIFEIDKARNSKSAVTIPIELERYACFAKGKTNGNYYVLFAKNAASSQQDVMLRLVEYNTNGARLRSLDFSAMASASLHGIKKLGYGNNDMVADDTLITGYIGRQMFMYQGEEHQASYAFAVRTDSFTQVKYDNSSYTPYASHSFHQIIVPDGDSYIYIDRCDNTPSRSFVLTKMQGRDWVKVTDSSAHSFLFKGEPFLQNGQWIYGNSTYSQFGGLIPFENKYMLVGTYQNNPDVLTDSSANLFVQFFDKDTMKPMADPTFLTDWNDVSGQLPCYRTIVSPQAFKIDEHRVGIAYMLGNKSLDLTQLRLMIIDDSGAVLSDHAVETAANKSCILPRFGSAFYNSEKKAVEWFTTQTDSSGKTNLVMRYIETESSPSLTPPESFDFAEREINLLVNHAVSLETSFVPANAGNLLSWTSSDESVVKVDPMGVLVGVGNGTAVVTATTRSGMTRQITVSVTGGKPATGIEVKFAGSSGVPTEMEETISVQKGDSYRLYATVLPEDASNRTYTVYTDRPEVIAVMNNGAYWIAIGGGTASLIVASVSNPEIRRVYHISVYAPGEVSGSDIYRAGDLVTFGFYPQSKVTDEALLAELNQAAGQLPWISYGYGAAGGAPEQGTDYMFYKDVALNGETYRAVTFTAYRPNSAGGEAPAAERSYQYQNGYETNAVYYFKYEPLVWRVLDPSTGYMVCTKVIDSQAYRNFSDASAGSTNPSDWSASSLRSWLNVENKGFFYTAFSDDEQTQIVASTQQGSEGDPIGLVTDSDIVNAAYGFETDAQTADAARVMTATDYAKCQGLYLPAAGESSNSANWWLNAPKQETRVGIVSADGRCDSDYSVQLNNIGVAPALRIKTANVGVDRIELTVSENVKTVYEIGDELDLSGVGISAFYSNCSGKSVSLDDCSVTNWNSTVAGEKSVIIKYYGKTVTLKVTVVKSLCAIELTEPRKLTYVVGESLNLSGMSVRARYTDGSTSALYSSQYRVSPLDSSTAGEKEITVSYQDFTASFTVTVKAVEQLIVTPPAQTSVLPGQPLDLTGFSVRAVYEDGSSEVLDSINYTVSVPDLSTPGDKTVTIRFAGYTTTFTVHVKAIEALLVTPPTKTAYFVGEALDLSGLAAAVQYDDGETVVLQPSDYSVSAFDPAQTGEQTLTVTYQGVSASFTVTVKAVALTSIRITTLPQKRLYAAGENLDTTGLALEASYSDGTKKTVRSGFTASADLRSLGRKTVTVRYTENGVTKTATYDVTVETAENTEIKILGFTASRTVDYKATVTFHYEAKNIYEGSKVHWYINGQDKGTEESCRVDKAKAKYTVQIKLIASDGKTVLKESEVETVNVKTNFFAKFVGFFKGLFGMLPKIDQR